MKSSEAHNLKDDELLEQIKQARIALNKAIQKLPIKARVVTREEKF